MPNPKDLHLDKIRLIRFNGYIKRSDRCLLNRHDSGLLWFTGYSGAGKSTIAHGVEQELYRRGIRAYVLDGDNIRHGLNADLGFSREDRKENIRRIVEVSRLMVDAGIIVLASFIAPYQEDRDFVRAGLQGNNYYEIHVKCSINECQRRDPKGMYDKARQGIIKNYTGVTAPYEIPAAPDLTIDTETMDIAASIERVLQFLDQAGLLGTVDPF
jgi:adenylylsulfate kinase